jgi:predicted secreted protein
MADIVRTEGLVLAINDGTNIYPFACAKNSTLTITSDFLELAPKTNAMFREFIPNRKGFTLSGSGLVKLSESTKQPLGFFNDFIIGDDESYTAYIDIIDSSNNYAAYEMECYITDLTLESAFGANPSYSFSLQGSGAIIKLTESDTYTVASGKITGRDTAIYKLVAIGYGGKWYYNYVVTSPSVGVFEITMGTSLNGTSVKAIYKTL